MKPSILLAFLATVSLAACTHAADTQPAKVDAPSVWSILMPGDAADIPLVMETEAKVEHDWWKHFSDPTLDQLMTDVLANNKTVAIAKARVAEARANRGVAKSALMPQISGTANALRGNQGIAANDKADSLAQAGVEASWELDLFGRNQARTAQAEAIVQSAEANRQAVMVALLAETARTYFDLRNFERQIALTQQNLQTQDKTLTLIRAQVEGALASDFDVQRAAAQVSTTEAQVPALQASYDATRNRLNVLLGVPPGTKDALLKTPQPLAPLDRQVIVSAPATVLATRPDVRAAERLFAASISAKKAATADLFPAISLTGFFGVQSSSLLSATPWSLGAGLVQPILNFGRLESQIDAADARQQQAFLQYQQTVLEALENMANALSDYLSETDRNVFLTLAVEQNRKAANLAKEQYTSGYTGLLDVLVAERNVLDAESAATSSDTALRQNLVNIYTAAGGGWDVKE